VTAASQQCACEGGGHTKSNDENDGRDNGTPPILGCAGLSLASLLEDDSEVDHDELSISCDLHEREIASSPAWA
jgi:hypothetical protein